MHMFQNLKDTKESRAQGKSPAFACHLATYFPSSASVDVTNLCLSRDVLCICTYMYRLMSVLSSCILQHIIPIILYLAVLTALGPGSTTETEGAGGSHVPCFQAVLDGDVTVTAAGSQRWLHAEAHARICLCLPPPK